MHSPMASAERRRILVIKLGALGDFFLAQTAFAGLRRHHAADHLTLLTLPSLAPLARLSGMFDAVLEDPRAPGLRAHLAIRRLLRDGRFHRVYDLQAQGRTARYHALLVPGPWPEWSGTARFASHPDRYPGRRRVPAVERYARQLAPLGVTLPAVADLSWLDADTARFALPPPYALLIPGSSPGRPEKRWPVERYAELAARLAAQGVMPAVIGGPAEAGLAAAIRAACPRAVDLTGRTSVAEIAGLARRAALVIGNDTGPTQIAAAVGAPTVALFSDASYPVQMSGPRVVAHHRPTLAAMDVDGVLAAAGRVRLDAPPACGVPPASGVETPA